MLAKCKLLIVRANLAFVCPHSTQQYLLSFSFLDPLVRFSLAAKSKQLTMERGATNYQVKNYPIQHTVSMEEISDVCQFLISVLPPDDTCNIILKPAAEMSVKELKAAIRKAGLQN